MSSLVKQKFRLEQDEDGYPPVAVESVWAAPSEAAGQFVLDNIPFFARAATLGDTVVAQFTDEEWWFERVVHRSGNSLVRVVFFDPARKEEVERCLQDLGCSTEYLGAHSLLAVSIPETSPLAGVQAYLRAEAAKGVLGFEEPILRQ